MSQSTDAIIAYGVDFQEEHPFPWDDGSDETRLDFDHWWAAQNGVHPPAQEWNEGNKSVYQTYWEQVRAGNKDCPCPVEVIRHCHHDYPMWILAIPGTKIQA